MGKIRIGDDFVHLCIAATTIHFQVTKHDQRPPVFFQKHKCIRRKKTCGVKHVRRVFAIGDDEAWQVVFTFHFLPGSSDDYPYVFREMREKLLMSLKTACTQLCAFTERKYTQLLEPEKSAAILPKIPRCVFTGPPRTT